LWYARNHNNNNDNDNESTHLILTTCRARRFDTHAQHKEQLEFSLKVSPDPLATREEIQLLFSNADQIYHFNQLILDELKQRVGDWSYRQLIGDIFVAKVRVHISLPLSRTRSGFHLI